MVSLSSPLAAEERAPTQTNEGTAAPLDCVVVVASGNDPVAADYVKSTLGPNARIVELSEAAHSLQPDSADSTSDVILFLRSTLTENDRDNLDRFLDVIVDRRPRFVGIVSSFRADFDDGDVVRTESHVLDRLKGTPTRIVIFRAGYILSAGSAATANLRRLGFCYPLVPRRLRSCCVDGEELFAAIDAERRRADAPKRRLITLLGANRPWKERLQEKGTRGPVQSCLTGICYLLSLLMLGHLAAIAFNILARWRHSLKRWNFDTLRPKNFQELLALYNPYNLRYVKAVGYNNGVVHFGHSYPDKSVVSTVLCNRIVRTGAEVIKADCGSTIRKAMDFLNGAGQELYVIPNYSYVCLGTAFFVPIHGSAADYSTVAETITRVLFYDPGADRMTLASSDNPAFRDHVYDMESDVLLLRLRLRVKPKARYFVHRQDVDNPSSADLLRDLRDDRTTNVEIRKSSAAGAKVQVCKYYRAADDATAPTLEIPRDSLGRLWDRLEENPVTSFLMHALTRWFAWHVELFFTADEFATFWKTHQTLPLRKIQLRYIRRDGLPHSPFCAHDCVSVDMFMLRGARQEFEMYLKRTFAVVRSNPGKHSK